jgi:predicted transposase YdaD
MARDAGTADIDRSLKALFREFPLAFFRLAGLAAPPETVLVADVSVNVPELRADQVLLNVGADGAPRRAIYLEYQLRPDRRLLQDWFLKCAGLTRQLGVPVLLVVLYLTRGRYRRFPSAYRTVWEGLTNEYRFHTVRLWEHAGRIRSGELGELAPLLVLCQDNPDAETLAEERDLIHRLDVSDTARVDLLALALMVGTRYFDRALLIEVFQEDLAAVKTSGIIAEWIGEGEARGEARGEVQAARRVALRLLRERFAPLPAAVVERVENEGLEWCEELAVRVLGAKSLTDLGF